MKKKLVLFIFLMLTSNISISQWSSDPAQNLRVTTTGLLPEIVTDGVGGAYILYKDMPLENVHLYLQRLDKYGYRKFAGNGIRIADSNRFQQQFFNLISDEHYGVIIGFQDVIFTDDSTYYYNAHVQRIDSTGQKLWGENGILIDKGHEAQVFIVSLCNDGTGGCYVFWGRYYNRNHKELWAQRVDKEGHIMWDSSGVMITDQFVSFDYPTNCLSAIDGMNGTICHYYDSTGAKLQRIDSNSNFLWGNGVTPFSKIWWANMKADVSNGVIIAGSYRSTYDENIGGWRKNIGAQRIDGDGNKLWGEDGIIVADLIINNSPPEMTINDLENNVIVWNSKQYNNNNIYAQKIDSTGNLKWKNGGIFIADAKFGYGKVATDYSGGAIIIWDYSVLDGIQLSSKLYGQYVNSQGRNLWASDILISSRTKISAFQTIPSENNGAIICWYEIPPDIGVYAQQVSINGNLGEVISTIVKNKIRNELPKKIQLFQNYPNPFNANTVIMYQISQLAFVNITIFDITGKEVINLAHKKQKAGIYQIIWEGKKSKGGDAASGLYFIQLKVDDYVKVIKSLLIK